MSFGRKLILTSTVWHTSSSKRVLKPLKKRERERTEVTTQESLQRNNKNNV